MKFITVSIIYREYKGGPVMKVVENVTKQALKSLFAGKK